jgi:hypothetical protein
VWFGGSADVLTTEQVLELASISVGCTCYVQQKIALSQVEPRYAALTQPD